MYARLYFQIFWIILPFAKLSLHISIAKVGKKKTTSNNYFKNQKLKKNAVGVEPIMMTA